MVSKLTLCFTPAGFLASLQWLTSHGFIAMVTLVAHVTYEPSYANKSLNAHQLTLWGGDIIIFRCLKKGVSHWTIILQVFVPVFQCTSLTYYRASTK